MKYVTFSYDDNSALNVKLLELFQQYHVKCTFNLNSGMIVPGKIASLFLGSKKMLSLHSLQKKLKGDSFEIACHGDKHLDLTKLNEIEIYKNISCNQQEMEKIFHKKITGFVYPYGTHSSITKKALKQQGFLYARLTESTYNFSIPNEFLLWKPTCYHLDQNLLALAEDFIHLDSEEDYLFYIWGHAWELKDEESWNYLTDFLNILKKDSTIIYLTNDEVFKKLNENTL